MNFFELLRKYEEMNRVLLTHLEDAIEKENSLRVEVKRLSVELEECKKRKELDGYTMEALKKETERLNDDLEEYKSAPKVTARPHEPKHLTQEEADAMAEAEEQE